MFSHTLYQTIKNYLKIWRKKLVDITGVLIEIVPVYCLNSVVRPNWLNVNKNRSDLKNCNGFAACTLFACYSLQQLLIWFKFCTTVGVSSVISCKSANKWRKIKRTINLIVKIQILLKIKLIFLFNFFLN